MGTVMKHLTVIGFPNLPLFIALLTYLLNVKSIAKELHVANFLC